METNIFCSAEEAIKEIKEGKVIIVVDDEDRENEGDFVCAAEYITPDIVNFMVTHGRGMLCTALSGKRLDELGLPLMVESNSALHGTQFTVTVDAIEGTTTGISAADRALTIKKLIDRNSTSADFARYLTIENAVSSDASESLYLHATDNGKSWKEGDYLYVININVTAGQGPAYIAAVKDLINSNMGKKAPGLLRLVASRAGGDTSHAILISAPSFVSLNKYLDSFAGEPATDAFISKVKDISTVAGTSIYRVVKMWKG